jgi:hypothetical protein
MAHSGDIVPKPVLIKWKNGYTWFNDRMAMNDYSQTANSKEVRPIGIGGWLVLIIIGLFASILLNLYGLISLFGNTVNTVATGFPTKAYFVRTTA